MSQRGRCAPPDQDQRDLILRELDRNMLVEAAAGTGKTTSMVRRMVALLSRGRCDIGTLAAVTFTRKAAAELRGRFQVALEQAAREATGEAKERLVQALGRVAQCFIGTIHSFCARLLRERPVDAQVDLAFEELDEEADARLRQEAWDAYAARLMARDADGVLGELDRVGLGLADLKPAFLRLADFPDVDEWPVPGPDVKLPPLEPVIEAVHKYVAHMRALAPKLPEDLGENRLMEAFRAVPRIASHYDLTWPPDLMHVLKLFGKKPPSVSREVLKQGWSKFRKEEQTRWKKFAETHAQPLLAIWRECRYAPILRALRQARQVYDDIRSARGKLNYQDLLMKSAAMLRDRPHVRRYFRERFTHVLVDEFQDTDPIQAEVVTLLCATDAAEPNWRRCRLRPGSLFIVGDPKQSIYRFRRADIVTYGEVKRLITQAGDPTEQGLVARLSANFRCTSAIVDWVNAVFAPRFPAEATDASPGYVALDAARVEGSPGDLTGVRVLSVPAEPSRLNVNAVAYESDLIARTIRHALDHGVTVPRTQTELERGAQAQALPSDFLIVTYKRAHLSSYARALQKYGIPHQVTGGTALNEVPELRLLHLCLTAVVQPDNPVSLVATLRSELFGLSDAALYTFRKAGGEFDYHTPVPDRLPRGEALALQDAYGKLRAYARWLDRLPAAAAIERIAADLGLVALAGAREGGDVEAGSLGKAIELLRSAENEMWTAAQLVDYLGQLVEAEEKYDGISALSEEKPVVRVMNLHKVKGLEAPVVFLADPTGDSRHEPEIHIDRSGDKTRGYMAVYGEKGRFNRDLLAHPHNWDELADREQQFLDAETLRLRYVAATRAGSLLVVTQRKAANKWNPWQCLEADLADAEELADPGAVSAEQPPGETLRTRDARQAAEAVALRLAQARAPTYDVCAAKAYALSEPAGLAAGSMSLADADGSASGPPADGEHGVEWGTVIHQLLDTAMSNPEADLQGLAAEALPEHGLDIDLAESAAALVRSVVQSEILRRAQAGSRCFTEAPFQVLHQGDAGSTPAILRGVIDLVFRETEGWVLVDYKTGKAGPEERDAVVAKYAPQVRLYAQAWETCTGEPVKEAGLLLVQGQTYVRVQ